MRNRSGGATACKNPCIYQAKQAGVHPGGETRKPTAPSAADQMSEDIPFDKSFDLPPGRVEEVMPGVRRILCNNPGPFTFKGTLTYIVGNGRVAIIDPGPLDEAHVAALLAAV